MAPAIALHADHLDHLALVGDQLGQRPGVGRGHRPGRGPDALGESRDHLGIEAIGLGEAAEGAGEGADLARVDHRERQAGAGERGGGGDAAAMNLVRLGAWLGGQQLARTGQSAFARLMAQPGCA